jgi:uncharacterized protein (UPF0216 family)
MGMNNGDDPVFRRWFRYEARTMNEGLAAERKFVPSLLKEAIPEIRTRSGGRYRFSIPALRLLHERVSSRTSRRLLLPIIFFSHLDVRGSLELRDPVAAEALMELGEISGMRRLDQGPTWIGRPIVLMMMQRYPSLIQIAMA